MSDDDPSGEPVDVPECVTCGSREDDVLERDCGHPLCDYCEEADDCYKCQDY